MQPAITQQTSSVINDRAGRSGVHFGNLDGLRFICFLGVFFFHTFMHLGIGVSDAAFRLPKTLLTLNMNSGEAGVAFFFVLSGFLITYLMLQEREKTGGFSIPQFYVRRALRIWPLYYSVVLFGFLACPWLARLAHKHYDVERAGLTEFLLFLANFDIFRHGMPVNGVLGVQWSLAVEEQFYLLWPLIFAAFSRSASGLRRYPWVFFAIIAGSFAFRAVWAGDRDVLAFHTLSVMNDLAIGGLIAYLAFFDYPLIGSVRRLPRRAIAVVYVVGIVTIMVQSTVTAVYFVPFLRLVDALFFAFVILEQNYAERSFVKMAAFPRMTRWGAYTYGLYSLHMIAVVLVAMVTPKTATLTWFLIRLAAATTITFSLAFVSYHLLEQPFLRLKARFSPLAPHANPNAGRSRNAALATLSTD